MKIEIQKIVRPVHLGDYAEEYGDQRLYVWVNPPRKMRMDYWEVSQEFRLVARPLQDHIIERTKHSE